MHRQNVARGQLVIQNGEDRFLGLARVLSAQNQHHAFCEIHRDAGFRARPIDGRVHFKIGRENYREVHREFVIRDIPLLQQQLPGEEGVPRTLRDHPYPQRIHRIRAAKTILYKQLLPFEEPVQPSLNAVENFRTHGLVHRSPVDGGFGGEIADNVLVLR